MVQCEEADSLYDGFKKFEHLANQLGHVFAEVKRMVKGYEVSGAVEAALAKVEANADSFNEATKVACRRLGNLTVVQAPAEACRQRLDQEAEADRGPAAPPPAGQGAQCQGGLSVVRWVLSFFAVGVLMDSSIMVAEVPEPG